MSAPELELAAGRLAVSSITLDGVAVPLAGVLADVTIRHGRAGYFDSASPSTCMIELLGVTRSITRPLRLGALLVVNATDGATIAPRFTGRLTDGDLAGDELTLIAVGRLRTLTGYTVGKVAYPEERWSSRVTRAFIEAGFPAPNLLSNGDFETDVSGWGAGSGASIAQSTTEHNQGLASLAMTTPGAAVNEFCVASMLAVPAGSVTFVAYVKAPAGARLYIDLYAPPVEAKIPFVGTGAWQEVTGTIPAFDGGTAYLYFATSQSGAPQALTAYLDSVSVTGSGSTTPDVLELVVGAFDPILLARPVELVSLDAYLGELAETVESAVADRPDGRILVQALTARTSSGATALDPAEVAYSPGWEIRLPAANVITIEYGSPAAKVTATDAASVSLYGPIETTISTDLKNAADANTIANARLARGAYAHWTTPATSLLYGRRLAIGAPVGLTALPASAPFPYWSPILEGWTDRIVSDGDELVWTMELALSDPLLSGLALSWASVPNDAAHRWNTINQTVAWRDAIVLSDLDP